MRNVFTLTVFLTSFLNLLGSKFVMGAADGDRKLPDSIVPTLVATNAAWSTIMSLNDGSLGLVYEDAQTPLIPGLPDSPNSRPNVKLSWMRSTDNGVSWSSPATLAERLDPVTGQRYTVRPEGGYIVYEQRNQCVGQLPANQVSPNGRIICAMDNLDYYYDSSGNSVKQYDNNAVFRYGGLSYTCSDDYGQTWQPLQSLPDGPWGGSYNEQLGSNSPYYVAAPYGPRIVTLSDGTAMMPVYGSRDPNYAGPLSIPSGTTSMAGVLRSTDNGITWDDPSLVSWRSDLEHYAETGLCRLPGDKLIAAQRTPEGSTVQYTSSDLGRTWSEPTPLTEGGDPSTGQHPTDIIRLKDGVLMATWGNRRAPYYGPMAMVSLDDGATWEYDNRVALAPTLLSVSSGYANAAQAGDGSILVNYYDLPAGGSDWDSGKIYTVRFTEQQFFDAAGLPYHAPEPSAFVLLIMASVGLGYYVLRNRK